VNDDTERQKALLYRSHEKFVPTSVCWILYCISFTQHCHPQILDKLAVQFYWVYSLVEFIFHRRRYRNIRSICTPITYHCFSVVFIYFSTWDTQ